MKANTHYAQIDNTQIPHDIRWDTPRVHRGQMVEISYADVGCASEAGLGSMFMRRIDHSSGEVSYYRRIGPLWID